MAQFAEGTVGVETLEHLYSNSVSAIEFPINTLEGTLAVLSMGAAMHGTSDSMKMMSNVRNCPIFILSAPFGHVWLETALPQD